MLGYVCKYTPMELFEAMDTEITRLEPSVTDFNHADTLMHANICSYTKAVLEDVMEHDYEGVILTTCCDSIRRLYDTLKSQFPDKFFFLLDIPRKFNDFAVTLYERQLKQMLTEYEAFSGKTPACLPAQRPKKETDRNSILVSWVPDATMKSVSCLSTAVPICCLI